MGNGQVLAQALLSNQSIPYLPLTLAVKGRSGLPPLAQWCLWGNLDTILCLRDWIWLSSDLAFDSPWDSSRSSYRDVTWSDSLFRDDPRSSSDSHCSEPWITGQSLSLTIPLVLAAGLSYVIRKRWEKK